MRNKDLHCGFSASKAVTEIFTKICRVEQWWTVDVLGEAGVLRGKFAAVFGESYVTMDVVEMRPYSRIVWFVRSSYWSFVEDSAAWDGSEIVWDVMAGSDAARTRLAMTHRGLRCGAACYDVFGEGWELYVGNSLRRYVEKGVGIPFNHKTAIK